MPGLTSLRTPVAVRAAARPSRAAGLSRPWFVFMTAVVVIQGGHMLEHVIQLLQVSVFDVPDDEALGLLGYVIQFNGTEERLHLGYNTAYLVSLYALIVPLWRITPGVVTRWGLWFFMGAGVLLETWHMVEHGVIISHVIANGGCPCPGIGDAALGVTDTVLHFFYNLVAYAGIAYAYSLVLLRRSAAPLPSSR